MIAGTRGALITHPPYSKLIATANVGMLADLHIWGKKFKPSKYQNI